MDFHLVKNGDRPLFAVPSVDGGLHPAGVACYPVHTWKKRVVRSAVLMIFATGLARRVWPARKLRLPGISEGELEGWLGDVRRDLGQNDLQPVIVWPSDPSRGRLYLYLLDAKGNKKAFCKLALDARNSALVLREKEALQRLHALDLKRCRIPAVLTSGLVAGQDYLVVATTPSRARITDWRKDRPIGDVIAEYGGKQRQLDGAALGRLDWWPAVERLFPPRHPFRIAIDEAAEAGASVCRVHGDVNQTNVLRDGEDIWLLDWEQSHEDGPALTDTICAAVDDLWLERPNDPEGNLRKFKQEFLDMRDEYTRHQVVLALAFLGAASFTPAIAMIRSWYPET